MRTVVDTSAWIEWMLDTPVGRDIGRMLPAEIDWIVPTMVELELAKWALREADRRYLLLIAGFSSNLEIVSLDTPTALLAARYCHEHKLATADAVIYATATSNKAVLLTCDAHFRDLPGVRYVAKATH